MNVKNRIGVMLLAFVLAVSFVHPFYGEISCAKEETKDLPGDAANTKTESVADLPETDTEDGQKKGETKDLLRTTDQNGETETVTEENKKAEKSEDTEEGREHKKEDKSEDTEEGQEKDKADKSEDTEEVQEKEQEEDTCGTAKQETDQVQTEETVDGNAEETEKNPQDQKAPVTDDTADVPEEAAEGDVIAFYGGAGAASIVTHRVVENRVVMGEIVTKGDANESPDMNPVPYGHYIGKVERSISEAGKIASVFTSPAGKSLAGCGVGLAVVLQVLASFLENRRRQNSN